MPITPRQRSSGSAPLQGVLGIPVDTTTFDTPLKAEAAKHANLDLNPTAEMVSDSRGRAAYEELSLQQLKEYSRSELRIMNALAGKQQVAAKHMIGVQKVKEKFAATDALMVKAMGMHLMNMRGTAREIQGYEAAHGNVLAQLQAEF